MAACYFWHVIPAGHSVPCHWCKAFTFSLTEASLIDQLIQHVSLNYVTKSAPPLLNAGRWLLRCKTEQTCPLYRQCIFYPECANTHKKKSWTILNAYCILSWISNQMCYRHTVCRVQINHLTTIKLKPESVYTALVESNICLSPEKCISNRAQSCLHASHFNSISDPVHIANSTKYSTYTKPPV